MKEAFQAWGKILRGITPFLSIEITRECPLSCPGCYAYGADHLGGEVTLRELRDAKGADLVSGVLRLIKQHRPMHVSIVGGEPLVRFRELSELLPELAEMGIRTQVVTSAVRPIPLEWASIPELCISVSIDGLQPEHDRRRKPATYDRILKNIEGHQISVHCTVTSQQARQDGYLEEFVRFWSARETVKRIWFSLYTPQIGETSVECLSQADRLRVIRDLKKLEPVCPKLQMPAALLDAYAAPPQSPSECTFARMTHSVSADLQTRITPCQFGGNPDCTNCGCMASAGMAAVERYKIGGLVSLGSLMEASLRIGSVVRRLHGHGEDAERKERDEG